MPATDDRPDAWLDEISIREEKWHGLARLRRQWEYSHAGALLQLCVMAAPIIAILRR